MVYATHSRREKTKGPRPCRKRDCGTETEASRKFSFLNREILFPEFEGRDERTVSARVFLFQIGEELPALADELNESTTSVVIFRVRLEVAGEVNDPSREKSDLNFGRPGVLRAFRKFRDHFSLLGLN